MSQQQWRATMGLISKTTGKSIRDTKEYKAGDDFLKSKEFKKLLKDNIQKFKDFDRESPEDLLKLRDHLYHELRKETPNASSSVDFIKVQIGVVAEKYKVAVKDRESNRRYQTKQVTTNPYAPLSRIPYGTRLRA